MTEVQWTDEERAAVIEEGEAITAHPAFRGSKRCVSLLRMLIEHAITGDADLTKERLLGIEVFGRRPDYDTNADPIVRMTANEIRKRLAQFYQETERHSAVKIRLVPGTYRLHFDFTPPPQPPPPPTRKEPFAPIAVLPEEPPPTLETIAPAPRSPAPTRHAARANALAWLASVLVLALAVTGYLLYTHPRAGDFWQPLLTSSDTIKLCVGAYDPARPNADWAESVHREIATHEFPRESLGELGRPVVPYVDVRVAAGLSTWLGAHRKQVELQRDTVLSLEDLRRGPAILIGAFDNHWGLVLLSGLRFHVQVDPQTKQEWIEDSKNPNQRAWSSSGTLQYTDTYTDYALVSRFLSPETGQWILSVGGLGMHGTEAAGELVTVPAFAKLLPTGSASRKNLQVVLKTMVINGNTGPPQVVAVYFW